jgi:hypothetical protein
MTMTPNGLIGVLANQKIDDELAYANRAAVRRSVQQGSRRGALRFVRLAIGDVLIAAGRWVHGSISDCGAQPVAAGTQV